MRRKNRKWVAMAVAVYLFVMWSSYRWGIAQRIPEGNIFSQIEREGVKRLAEERAKAAAAAVSQSTGELRLTAAGPAFIAARYDATHVVFVVAAETESRFSSSPLRMSSSGTPTRVSPSLKPAAALAGLQELWEPDSQALHFFPEIIQKTQPGEQWTLSVSPESTIPVAIDRVVVAPMGCSLALGFLASVPPEQQAVFGASHGEYFAVRRTAVEPVESPVASHIAELREWKASPGIAKQIEQQLNQRMQQEVSKIDARLLANRGTPGANAGESPLGSARPRLREWIHADQALLRGEGALVYDVRAFRLTPDGMPRLFVRARWKLADATVFLMSAWFRTDPAGAQAALLFADASWSASLREGNAGGTLDDRLDFQAVLNEFDADHDGWAELLIHSYDVHPDGSASTAITLYLYTDLGLVAMKTPLRRDAQPPESCIDP